MKIDLRTCKRGDTLISSHGMELKYIRPTYDSEYLDHLVSYPDRGNGTRTHDGFVFKFNRKPETDHDIVEIIRK